MFAEFIIKRLSLKQKRQFLAMKIFNLTKILQVCLVFVLLISLFPGTLINADNAKIQELEQKLSQTITTAKTLKSEIAKLDDQVELTTLRIVQTEADLTKLEEEITVLGGRIDRIRGTLTTQSDKVLIRITNTYKNGRISPLDLFLSSNDFGKLLARYKYLKTIQQSDRKILGQLQTTKSSYTNQKETLEDKKLEAEKLKASLGALQSTLTQQKKEKENLLAITKNDELRYQKLLTEARAEVAAVFQGGGTYLRDVNAGDKIGSVIIGASGCSSGTHLHFEIHKNNTIVNPSDYLKNQPFSYEYSDLSYYGSIDPHGPLDWPLDSPIGINQGYGSHTFARSFYPNGVHAGIDMEGGSLAVKAVKSGKLFAGSYKCSNGPLSFAKVVHDDGLETFYLHIFPQ